MLLVFEAEPLRKITNNVTIPKIPAFRRGRYRSHGLPAPAAAWGRQSTHGDFNVAWHVQLVIFTHAAFLDGKINTRITTLSQINALVKSGDAIIADTPITFNCSSTSERTYDIGTPKVIAFP